MEITAYAQPCPFTSPKRRTRFRLVTKILLVMNLTAIFLTAGLLSVSAAGLSQNITFHGDNVTLEKVFIIIKEQTGFSISYKDDILVDAKPVSVDANNLPLSDFLDIIFSNQPIQYRLVSRTIFLSPKPVKRPTPEPEPQKEPSDVITGSIFSSDRVPLSGATILLRNDKKEIQRQILSDPWGRYIIDVSPGDVLTVSYIGYETQEFKITTELTNKRILNIVLKIAVSNLDEAVVQAYGVTSRRLTTGNITKVSGEEIRKQPVMNPLLALEGRVPGLVVTPISGYAGSPVKVELRGRNSLNSNFSGEPLYIIDGIPRTVLDLNSSGSNNGVSSGLVQGIGAALSLTKGQSPLYGLNPDDIESIEVLKDGDATAIYGSRAANGVIIITTKKAKSGQTAFSLSIQEGIMDIPRYPKMFGTQEYLQIRREAFKNDGLVPTAANAPDLMLWDSTRYTDWTKELLSTGRASIVSAVVSGGDNRNTFRLSGSYNARRGMLNKSGKDEVIGLNASFGHHSNDQKLVINLDVAYNLLKNNAIEVGNTNLPPNAPAIYDAKGDLNYLGWGGAVNNPYPFAKLRQPNISKTNSFRSAINISYNIRKGLALSVTAGYNNSQNSNDNFQTIASQNPLLNPTGTAYFSTTGISNWSLEPNATYSFFIGKGKLDILAGASMQASETKASTEAGLLYTNDNLIGSISNAGLQQVLDDYGQYKYAAVFGRIGYNWDNKYLINVSARRDGSSRFAPGKQYGNFGSAGAAWIISEEPWVRKNLPSWISFMKLRTSYGITGNDQISDYQYLSQWSLQVRNAILPTYGGVRGYTPIHAVNQQYQWESNKKFESALSLAFLANRINLDVAFFRNIAGDQLTTIPTPVYSGFTSVVGNSEARVENTGWEGSVNARLIDTKDFSWSASFNIGHTRNRLLAFPGLESSPYATTYKIGSSLSTEYKLRYLGIDPLTGNYAFDDYNKDGVITTNYNIPLGSVTDDRYVKMELNPKYDGGLRTDLRYKSVGLSFAFSFRNQLVTDRTRTEAPGKMKNVYLPDDIRENSWHQPGDQALYPRFTTLTAGNFLASDAFYTNGTYLRLQNIALTYSLPEKLVKKANMKSCRFSVNINNVFMITRYNGFDPNVYNTSGPPPPRVIVGNLSFTF